MVNLAVWFVAFLSPFTVMGMCVSRGTAWTSQATLSNSERPISLPTLVTRIAVAFSPDTFIWNTATMSFDVSNPLRESVLLISFKLVDECSCQTSFSIAYPIQILSMKHKSGVNDLVYFSFDHTFPSSFNIPVRTFASPVSFLLRILTLYY